jgi:hypothetical protein
MAAEGADRGCRGHVAAHSSSAGEFRGVDEVLAYLAKRHDQAGGSFHLTPRGIPADDEASHSFRGRATR